MLKKLRKKKTAKKVWIILAILIVPAFVLWGSGSLIRSKEAPASAGKIFGRTISLLEFQDALAAVKTTVIMQFGEENLPEVGKYLNLEQQAWERLILLHEAKKRKISASDKEVVELIESYPFFQRAGKFDSQLYYRLLQYPFHTQPRIFEEQTRENLMISKLYRQVTEDIKLSEEELKNEYRKFNEEISLNYIASNPADFAKGIQPSEEELKDYFSKNSLNFKQPLSYNLEYIAFDSEDKLKEATLRLNKKEGLERIAKDLGAAVKETGLFGQTDAVPGIGWSPEILALVSKLRIGQYSPPLKADKFYYVLRLKEKKEAYIPEFEKIKDKVTQSYIKDKSEELAKAKIEDCLKKLKELQARNPKSVDFIKAAAEFGLKSDSTGMFKYGSYIEGIGASDIFWMKAQELKPDEFSSCLSAPGAFYIIKLKSRTPIDEKKFESEKAEFNKKISGEKQQEFFAKFTEELKRKAQ